MEFEYSLVENLFFVLLEGGDREGLVTLLSTRCPRVIYIYEDVETALAFGGDRRMYPVYSGKLDDPLLILGDAYAKCKFPEVRKQLAAALRRAFGSLGRVGQR